MKKIARWSVLVVTTLIVIISVRLYFRVSDRFPGYNVDIDIRAGQPKQLLTGFGAVPVTPEIVDSWIDANNDGRFFEEDGDSYQDNNGNGKFDAVWMAGFSNRRPANGVHDDLWARAIVIDDGFTRLAIVAIDAIGFGSDDVISSRSLIQESAGIDYCIVTSSHTHEAPDLVGIWGASDYSSGVDKDYRIKVQQSIAKAVDLAIDNLKPSFLRITQDLESGKDWLEDTRLPYVTDHGIRIIQAVSIEDSTTLGTLFSWANHPEVLWDRNLKITSDFPHYVREYTENGIYNGDSLIVEGLGGTTLYLNGAIGGLMTTSPEMEITDPITKNTFKNPSFEKADAVGKNLAMAGLRALSGTEVDTLQTGSISLKARSLELALENPLFRVAALLGVINRGMTGWFMIRSEIAYWSLGPVSFLHVPGEIYPEIINGGIEAPEGRDFQVNPMEIPPLRDIMDGKYKFVVGLSNDLIGYVIPKSQWDETGQNTYGYLESPYGEINSIGPDTAPILHSELSDLIRD